MKQLLKEYRATLRGVKSALEELRDIPELDRTVDDRSDINNLEAISVDLGFAIRYMEQRKYPDALHPITRWSTERREILMEPDMMNRVFGVRYTMPSEMEVIEADPEVAVLINKYLDKLSGREKECFLMIYEKGLPYRETAHLLGVSSGRVNNIMCRVRRKFQALRDMEKSQPE